jgi:plastocyanin domain-containing protein
MKLKLTLLIALSALSGVLLGTPRAEAQMSCCQMPRQGSAATKGVPASQSKGGVQRATVVINGGYSPASITVSAGKPVELTFVRKSAAGCDGELVIPSLKVNKTLKQGEKTVVKFTPKKRGTLAFSCGMNMYKGSITVK